MVKKKRKVLVGVPIAGNQAYLNPKNILRHHFYEYRLKVVGREKEYNKIIDVIDKFSKTGLSNTLQITGVPGSGKTYTVQKALLSHRHVYLNCSEAITKTSIYKNIQNQLSCKKETEKSSNYKTLLEHFTICTEKHIVVLDEIDLLYTRNQKHLYTLYEIPHHNNTKILLISISNTFDFTLDSKIVSRIGSYLMRFEPYKSDQILKIINCTEKGSLSDFKLKNLIARRVAAISGDIRKALKLHLESKGKTLLETDNVIQENNKSLLEISLPYISKYQKLIIRCVYENNNVNAVYEKLIAICNTYALKPINFDVFYDQLRHLRQINFLSIRKNFVQINYIKEIVDDVLRNDSYYNLNARTPAKK